MSVSSELVSETLFTAFILGLMFYMRFPQRGLLKSVFHNIALWIYFAFWGKTLVRSVCVCVVVFVCV